MDDQMKFYVSGDGAVLEHSAGYHLFGLRLLGFAFRYFDLMHRTPPQEWVDKYDSAKRVYATLRRPDGSLPMFGDTDSEADSLGPRITTFGTDGNARRLTYEPQWRPEKAEEVDPVAGYSVWWDGLGSWPDSAQLSQTVVTWSNFGDHAHKHADEMSLLLWAGGRNWWNSVGYWPYGTEGREGAESWDGSNAPHLIGESYVSSRTTRLVSSGRSDELAMLELERIGPADYVARREVIHWKPDFWVVLDSTSGRDQSYTRSTWTTASDVRWDRGQADGSFVLGRANSNKHLNVFFFGSQGTTQRLLRGSYRPFAGWQVEEGRPVASTSLVTEQPAKNSWAATAWTWETGGDNSRSQGQPQMNHWANPTDWEMQLPLEAGEVTVRRQGDQVQIRNHRGSEKVLRLTAAPNVSSQLAQLRAQFISVGLRYPAFHGESSKRLRVTYLLAGLFVLQQLFFVVYKRIHAPKLDALRWLSLMAWIVGGICLVGIYF